jgi:hypothetical protein
MKRRESLRRRHWPPGVIHQSSSSRPRAYMAGSGAHQAASSARGASSHPPDWLTLPRVRCGRPGPSSKAQVCAPCGPSWPSRALSVHRAMRDKDTTVANRLNFRKQEDLNLNSTDFYQAHYCFEGRFTCRVRAQLPKLPPDTVCPEDTKTAAQFTRRTINKDDQSLTTK